MFYHVHTFCIWLVRGVRVYALYFLFLMLHLTVLSELVTYQPCLHTDVLFMVSVSLKAKLSPSELFTLIMDVRQHVEMDDTGNKLGARQMI